MTCFNNKEKIDTIYKLYFHSLKYLEKELIYIQKLLILEKSEKLLII